MRRSKSLALVLALSCWLAAGARGQDATPQLTVADASGAAGAAVTVEVALASAPEGLQQYSLTVELGDPSLAEFVSVEGVAIAGALFQVSELAPARVSFRALDLNDQVRPGATDVVLARLTLEGRAAGSTTLTLFVDAYVDDRGLKVDPAARGGALTVRDAGSPSPARRPPAPLPAFPQAPRDLNGDGLYEDVNGDGTLDAADADALDAHLQASSVQADAAYFDFNGDGRLDAADVAALRAAAPAVPAPAATTVLRLTRTRASLAEPAAVDLVLVAAPQGLQRYDVIVRLEPANAGRMEGVEGQTLPADFLQVVAQSADQVRFRAADLTDLIRPGAVEVPLARLTLRGLAPAAVALVVEPVFLSDELSQPLAAEVQPGEVVFIQGPQPLEAGLPAPRDLDGDGRYEDVNGDGVFDVRDAVLLAFHLDDPAVRDGVSFFDFNGDGAVTFADAASLQARLV